MIYDVIILGSGPAGLSAAIYAARANLSTLVIEKGNIGGQISLTTSVDNYPGLDYNPTGFDMSERMWNQAEKFGAMKVLDEIVDLDLEGDVKTLKSKDKTYEAKTVILATGANPRELGVPGEKEFTGKGVAYCATCDGPFYTDLEVYVVGGGDAAIEEAIFLTKFARKVNVLYRGDSLRAAKSIQDKAFANDKIEIFYNREVKEIYGDMAVNKMKILNNKTGEEYFVETSGEDSDFGVFIFIGYLPNTGLFDGMIDMDKGYIVTDENMATNIAGVYAVGDMRKKRTRQVVTAAADGAIGAISAEKYLESK